MLEGSPRWGLLPVQAPGLRGGIRLFWRGNVSGDVFSEESRKGNTVLDEVEVIQL